MPGDLVMAVQAALRERGVYVGSSDPYAGFFGIPLDRPRPLTISNTGGNALFPGAGNNSVGTFTMNGGNLTCLRNASSTP